jgi:hypothetical protein
MFKIILVNLLLLPTYSIFLLESIAPIGWALLGVFCTIFIGLYVSESVLTQKGLYAAGVNILAAFGLCYSYITDGVSLFGFSSAVIAGISVGVVFASLIAGIFTLNYRRNDKFLMFWMLLMSTVLNSLPLISHLFF